MTTPTRPAASLFTATFLTALILFTIHRGFTYSYLNGSVPSSSHAASIAVGTLSDIWVAYMLAVVTGLIAWAVSLINAGAARTVCLISLAVLTTGLCAHQGYVEFFRFQIEPFHVRYLTDWQFVTSNSESFVTIQNGVMLASATVLGWLLFFGKTRDFSRKQWAISLTIISAVSLLAHNRNIHYRVQWFVPDNLQTNLFETLYLRSKNKMIADRLPPSAYDLAAAKYPPANKTDSFDRTLFSASFQPSDDAMTVALRQAFTAKTGTAKPPVILVVLLESLRPAETGFFEPTLPSLTPFMDKLANEGIRFTRAFSTGSVTRGGQEAVLCGNASGRSTSLMRNYDNLSYTCITDLFSDQKVHRFWYHGGDGRFDDQEVFWKRHNVQDMMTIRSFPENAAKTGWGVGDKTFFEVAARQLSRSLAGSDFGVGIMLSVTNHIPWRLPGDYIGPVVEGHPSWQTTRYTDEAVEALVAELKNSGDWDSTLLFIVSDHGNKVTPYADLYVSSPNRDQLLQSHINLIMSGGIASAALKTVGKKSAQFDHIVSQTDIAVTIAGIIGGDADKLRIMGKSLFDTNSSYPVISQTEDGIYVPAIDKVIPYNEVRQQLPDRSADDWIYRFHFQAVNEFLIEMRTASR